MSKLYLNTDGGSRGNPGPAAIGVVFFDESENVIHTAKEFIGTATNNQAEYRAIIKAFDIINKSKWLLSNNHAEAEIICRLDSQLVVEQICGRYKVKNQEISILLSKLNELKAGMKMKIIFSYVPREQNKLADKLVNEALDEKLKK